MSSPLLPPDESVGQAIEASTRPSRPLTSYHKIAYGLFVVVAWLPMFVFPWAMGVASPGLLGRAAPRVAISLVVFAVIAALIDWPVRQWSRWPAVVVFAMLVSPIPWVFYQGALDARVDARVFEFEREANRHVAELRQLQLSPPPGFDYTAEVERSYAELGRLASGLPTSRTAHKLVTMEFLKHQTIAIATYRASIDRCNDLGGMTAVNIRSKQDVELRRERFEAAFHEHERFLNFLRGFHDRVYSRIRDLGGPTPTPESEVAILVTRLTPGSPAFTGTELEHEIVAKQLEVWNLLLEAWGHWTAESGIVRFSGPRQDEWEQRLEAADQKITELRKKLERMKQEYHQAKQRR